MPAKNQNVVFVVLLFVLLLEQVQTVVVNRAKRSRVCVSVMYPSAYKRYKIPKSTILLFIETSENYKIFSYYTLCDKTFDYTALTVSRDL